jgi:hypothetical protein
VAVDTGISPVALLELDGDLFDAVLEAYESRWPLELELAASTFELLHAHALNYRRVNFKGRVPEVYEWPRPGRQRASSSSPAEPATPAAPRQVSLAELAELAGRRHLRVAPEPASSSAAELELEGVSRGR